VVAQAQGIHYLSKRQRERSNGPKENPQPRNPPAQTWSPGVCVHWGEGCVLKASNSFCPTVLMVVVPVATLRLHNDLYTFLRLSRYTGCLLCLSGVPTPKPPPGITPLGSLCGDSNPAANFCLASQAFLWNLGGSCQWPHSSCILCPSTWTPGSAVG
jgi:hypothetical protein